MTEYESSKLDHEKHLLLDQGFLRLPNEVARANLKAAQIQIKGAQDKVTDIISTGTKATAQASESSPEDAASKASASLDQAITRLQTLKRKLSALNSSTEQLYKQSAARVQHLEDLYTIPSLADVKYEEWSRIRLDRLLVDYLLRMGYTSSARALAKEKRVELLVDCDEFETCERIERSLRVEKRLDVALGWCADNKGALKKMVLPAATTNGTSNGTSSASAGAHILEYELRLQQCVELARQGHRDDDMAKLGEAKQFANRYLQGHPDHNFRNKATLLLCFPPPPDLGSLGNLNMNHPLSELYSSSRWDNLAQLFIETHHAMYQLSQAPLLNMALTAGLSALKTPACHSKYLSPTSGLPSSSSPSHSHSHSQSQTDHGSLSPPLRDDFDAMDGVLNGDGEDDVNASAAMSIANSVCPICSTELNKLSKHLPFAHHGQSHVEHDSLALPNGRVYGRDRLVRLNEKLGTGAGNVRDPMDAGGRTWKLEECKKVFFL